ncbi:MAG: hypothetical protein U5L46_11310 [Agrobacterium sp.]|nr:hypothetical protein [Agrobacterium sp.]
MGTSQHLFFGKSGQELYPMLKVASGGGLSRISLAIEVCVAHQSDRPVLIFDEVDVGVGGGVADRINSEIIKHFKQQTNYLHHPSSTGCRMGCTSLAYQQTNRWRTNPYVGCQLSHDQRVDELGRMLGTGDQDHTAQEHA